MLAALERKVCCMRNAGLFVELTIRDIARPYMHRLMASAYEPGLRLMVARRALESSEEGTFVLGHDRSSHAGSASLSQRDEKELLRYLNP